MCISVDMRSNMKISFLFETKILAVSHSMKQNVLFKFFVVQPSHMFFFFYFSFPLKQVLLCSPGWPRTLLVDQPSLKVTEVCLPLLPEYLKTRTTTPSLTLF